MPKKPDVPGTYRIKRQASTGLWLLSGVSTTGKRIRIPGLTYPEAERTGVEIFGAQTNVSGITDIKDPIAPIAAQSPQSPVILDDWGLPVGISVDTAKTVNASLGLGQGPPQPGPGNVRALVTVDDGEADKRVKRAKQAKSLMELAGVSWAAADCWIGRKVTRALDCDPVNPNPRQVNDLADVTKESLQEWFGDINLKPWQMMILLSFGIPLSMVIQSPKNKREQANLKAVP